MSYDFYNTTATLLHSLLKVVVGPNTALPEGTVISMHHPEEEEEEDEDEFLSDDAEVCHSKDQTKLKGQCWSQMWFSNVPGNKLCFFFCVCFYLFFFFF